MPTSTLSPLPTARQLHPAGKGTRTNPVAPRWVIEQTGVSAATLNYWRRQGFLTRPGHQTACGTGHRFDWESALDQIMWLKQLHGIGHVLDVEDARAGWRLRSDGARFALRCDLGQWVPVPCLSSAVHMLDHHAVLVTRVRP